MNDESNPGEAAPGAIVALVGSGGRGACERGEDEDEETDSPHRTSSLT